jgi:hypothetical protein
MNREHRSGRRPLMLAAQIWQSQVEAMTEGIVTR